MASQDPNELELDVNDDDLLDTDFQDDLGDGLDDEIYDDPDNFDENWEEDTAPEKPAKKKTSLFNIIVIGGAVLIGGGILVSTLTGNKSTDPASNVIMEQTAPLTPEANLTPPPSSDPNSLANIQDSATIPSEPPQQAQANAARQGFMNDPTQLDQPGQAPSLPESAPMTGFGDAAPAPGANDLPLPQQNLPNIDQIKKAAPVVETAVSTPAPVEPTPAAIIPPSAPIVTSASQSDAPSDREIELQKKLDAAVNRIDALEKRLTEQALLPVETSSNSSESPVEIVNLRNAVQRLEARVLQLSNTPVVQSSSTSFNDEMPAKVVVKKSVPAKKKKTSRQTSSPTPKPATISSSKWELRGARPGEAMVGKPGQAELKILRVGDSAVGIGQIQSISQVGGVWVVQGTSGSIRQ